MRFLLATAVLACVVPACGTRGLVDAAYPGEVLATIDGRLTTDGTAPRLAVAWLTRAADVEVVARGGAGTCAASLPAVFQGVPFEPDFPQRFTLSLFRTPPAAAQHLVGGARLALGWVVSYEDTNGDGSFGDGERELGSSRPAGQLVVFTDGAPGAAWLPAGLAPGFSVIARSGGALRILPADARISVAPSTDCR